MKLVEIGDTWGSWRCYDTTYMGYALVTNGDCALTLTPACGGGPNGDRQDDLTPLRAAILNDMNSAGFVLRGQVEQVVQANLERVLRGSASVEMCDYMVGDNPDVVRVVLYIDPNSSLCEI